MEKPIIEIKNISKKYNINHQKGGYISLRDVIIGVLKNPFRFAANKAKHIAGFKEKEEFWALKEVSISINKGEVIGVIGPNGAGKSTLLKILSQITPPTEGEIILRGNVGSLLEVGTGFHPELTGRENIFLNGAILGMGRQEIINKFDQIVEFAGIEKFLDTPVKYYSSGMYVRLAFSVAAHLEPDILVVDEVLAVGDAEFQKKCLGKMDEIRRKDGRTIIFVSHNMAAIQALCSKCVLFEKGRVAKYGATEEVIRYYLSNETRVSEVVLTPKSDQAGVTKIWLEDKDGNKVSSIEMGGDIFLNLEYVIKQEIHGMDVDVLISKDGIPLLFSFDTDADNSILATRSPGQYTSRVKLPTAIFKTGLYSISILVGAHKNISDPDATIKFEITNTEIDLQYKGYHPDRPGFLYMDLKWNTKKI